MLAYDTLIHRKLYNNQRFGRALRTMKSVSCRLPYARRNIPRQAEERVDPHAPYPPQ
jgi:hypothetical protein